ncbi:hypothetical protein [Actinoalloteichus hymeniacidonis]|uniref:Uncharacterized protein n=1 Tax=Actinoalloteichus hymeniacidonis TaxID=340345 RepID=A0AAC9HS71_9PSEU|nr:hypothetical protein [Actinoalloteichus hymeniacidonis]AOS63996.1 hypothetical protein TL08_15970 [Actinoalloteichus hymeniacidonis]MBB5907945.1 hypothetical protein [Actinoalloteichus hymeniacidonis]
MSAQHGRVLEKAAKRLRDVRLGWEKVDDPPIGREAKLFMDVVMRAETALFRAACVDLDDPGPRLAYGKIASLRSGVAAALAESGRGLARRLWARFAIDAARATLWAFDRDEIGDLRSGYLARPPREPSLRIGFDHAEETWVRDCLVFGGYEGVKYGALSPGEIRIVAAADARFALAERLASFRPPADNPVDVVTAQELDALLRVDKGSHRSGETLAWHCRLPSCRFHDGVTEARILATEAAEVYRILGGSSRLGPGHIAAAERRRDAILYGLPTIFA